MDEDEVATCLECKKSAHRYCAGVPMDEFNSADGSYTCLSCLKKLQKSQLADMSDNLLTILFHNARSLVPKIDELSALCLLHNPGVVCVVESCLSPDVTDSEHFIQNYQIVRLHRNRHGGGVLMYVHKCLSYKVILKGPAMLEF